MKKITKLIGIFVAFSLLSACATKELTSVVPFNIEYNEKIYNSSVGVIVLTPNREIEFSDMIYKVLYYEMAESFFSFDGLWDPESILTQKSMQTLQEQFGMKTVSLSSNIDPLVYEKYLEESKKTYKLTRKRYKSTVSPLSTGFLHEYRNNNTFATSMPNKKLLKAAEELNLENIMEISLTGISIFSVCFNAWTKFYVYAQARLISVSDGKVIWADKGVAYSAVEDVLSPNDLESIKEYYNKTVVKLCDPNVPPKVMKTLIANSYLFGNLAKETTEK